MTSTASPPVHIPTLQDVIEPATTAPAVSAALDDSQRAVVLDQVVAHVLEHLTPLFQLHLQQALAALVQRESEQLAHQIRDEIELVVRQCAEDVLASPSTPRTPD